jgi:ribosome-binding protein aMBF1 (putative translation factor)
MPGLTRKHHIDNSVTLTVTGPGRNREKVVELLGEYGFIDISDGVPWRDAFEDHDETKEVGDFLAGARYREGLTQKQLSEATGVPQRHISEMENGKRPIGKANAKKFGKAMDVDYRAFL